MKKYVDNMQPFCILTTESYIIDCDACCVSSPSGLWVLQHN